ncbi:MAG: ECF-type sigma factor [Planctomycetota bacterium]
MPRDITEVLDAMNAGDCHATEELLPLVYEELRRMAGRKMNHEMASHTLQPTALVHEAFLRLVGDHRGPTWEGRPHFFAAAAEAMRRILIESARRRRTEKRGGDRRRTELTHVDAAVEADDAESLLALDEALTKLERTDSDLAKLVELRYFTGLTVEQTADMLGTSPRTVKRHWAYARAWLHREMNALDS